MTEQTRREFLKSSSILTASALTGGLAPRYVFAQDNPTVDAKGPNAPTLVVVYLRGGADPLNTIIPFGDPMYYEHRPTIAIPAVDQNGAKGALHINNYFGFHPAMTALHEMFKQGMVAPILNVGSPHDTRSHFDAQDFMERAAPGVKAITEGWLNRYLGMTAQGKDNEMRALSFQMLLPRSLRGQFPVLAVPDQEATTLLNTFEGMYSCEENQEMAKAVAAGKPGAKPQTTGRVHANKVPERKPLTAADTQNTIVKAGINEIRRLRELKAITAAGHTEIDYPSSRFARQMRDIATVIKSNRGLEVAAIDYEGWDHHAYQGGSEGTMANMLEDVSSVIKAFFDDLGPEQTKKTLVLTMSEFGRTVKENGSNGSDHGHGGFMLAVGGMVKGKSLYGNWTGLDVANLYEKRDLPVHVDFRMVFAETLERLFGFDTMKSQIFPEFRPRGSALNFLNPVKSA